MRRRVRRGRVRPSRSWRMRRDAPKLSGPSRRCGGSRGPSARSRTQGGPGRRAITNRTSSSRSRRAAKARASAELASSDGASSTATSTGPSAARARNAFRVASAIAFGSGGGPSSASARTRATARARRWGPGSASRTSGSIPSNRSTSPALESRASASVGRAQSVRRPRARAASTIASHRVVLPMPGSPVITSPLPEPSGPSRVRAVSSSGSRPTSGEAGRAFIRGPGSLEGPPRMARVYDPAAGRPCARPPGLCAASPPVFRVPPRRVGPSSPGVGDRPDLPSASTGVVLLFG